MINKFISTNKWLVITAVLLPIIPAIYVKYYDYSCIGFLLCIELIIAELINQICFVITSVIAGIILIWMLIRKLLLKKKVDKALKIFVWLIIFICSYQLSLLMYPIVEEKIIQYDYMQLEQSVVRYYREYGTCPSTDASREKQLFRNFADNDYIFYFDLDNVFVGQDPHCKIIHGGKVHKLYLDEDGNFINSSHSKLEKTEIIGVEY